MTDLALPFLSASPAAGGTGPGVLLVHEGMGISPQLIRFAERLAATGYLVVAPDFFFRSGGPEAADFGELVGAITLEQLRADLATGVGYLRERGATLVGVTGFCMGGLFTYRAAKWAVELGIQAAAPFYGGGLAHELGDLGCPTTLFFGGRDEWIPTADIEAARERHGDDVVVYDDAEHGFMRDGSPSYDETAATDAWQRLLALFGRELH